MVDDSSGIRQSSENGVMTLTIDRPERGNALRPVDRNELISQLAAAHTDPAIRCVVLRSEGRHFCTGADVGGLGTADGQPAVGDITRRIMGGAQRLIAAILDCDKPVITLVHGAAAGLGAHLAFASDFAIASTEASFIEAFVLRGLTVDAGGAYLLPRLIGLRKAKELALLGDKIDGTTAFEVGLVNKAVAPGELDQEGAALAARLSQAPTTALSLTKRLFNGSLDGDRAASFQLEGVVQELQSHSPDSVEGVRSFVERRPPKFQGR
jgi:2-(1,2-epoxy-1,2-dihydrophenyl)acetyl-CoA isomerase